jgi:hypothetical protein
METELFPLCGLGGILPEAGPGRRVSDRQFDFAAAGELEVQRREQRRQHEDKQKKAVEELAEGGLFGRLVMGLFHGATYQLLDLFLARST